MLDLSYKYRLIITFFIALVAAMIAYRPILKIAKSKNIVDNPGERKLQESPVPVMGGIAVFFGIAVGLCFYKTMINFTILFPVLAAMTVMLYIGSIDDILTIKPSLRFLAEILVAGLLLFGMRARVSCFQGLWGIENIPFVTGIILSVITFVGITNAINMIDGVDGLSSSFCIMILGSLGIICFLAHAFSFAALAAVSIGGLFPFFIHNSLGKESKMYIGDGGTMMMGTIISSMVITILSSECEFYEFPHWDFSRIAFVVATLSIPIADTLRVMFVRILHRESPFRSDKNHFHHILLKYGLPPLGVAAIEVGLNLIVIAVCLLSWRLGASAEWQLYSVVICAALSDWVLAPVLSALADSRPEKKQRNRESAFLKKLQKIIDGTTR